MITLASSFLVQESSQEIATANESMAAFPPNSQALACSSTDSLAFFFFVFSQQVTYREAWEE